MIYLYNDEGNITGKFNLSKATEIASNRRQNDTRFHKIYRTASGGYVRASVSMWQGECNGYSTIKKSEAIELMERWGYDETDIKAKFGDYIEVETY